MVIEYPTVAFVVLVQGTVPAIFRMPIYLVAIPIVIAAGLITLSIVGFAKRAHPVLCFIPLGVALIPGLLFAPAMYFDRVEVHPDHIEQTTGLFFAPRKKGFSYKDVSYVHIKQGRNQRNRMETLWEIHETNGNARDIDPGDLWDLNESEIISLLKKYGVSFR